MRAGHKKKADLLMKKNGEPGSTLWKDKQDSAIWYYEVSGDEGNTAGDPLYAAANAFESESYHPGDSRQVPGKGERYIGLAIVFLG